MKSPLIKRTLIASLGVTGLVAAGSALAADNVVGPYVGLNIGASQSSLKAGGIDGALGNQGLSVSSGSSDHSDTAWSANFGYRFSPYLAAEVGYVDFGKFNYHSSVSAPANDSVSGDFKAHGITAAAVGILPLRDRLSAYGKLGLIAAHSELTGSSSAGAVAVSNNSHDSTGLLTGAGLRYDFTPNIAGTVEWNRYGNVGSPSTAYGSINTYTVGMNYKF